MFYREVRAWLEKYLLAGVAANCAGGPPVIDGQPPPVEDTGLRRILTWTFVALVVSLLMAYIGVGLAIRFFDRP